MEDWVLDTFSEDAEPSNEGCLLPLSVEPLAFPMPLGAVDNYYEGQEEQATNFLLAVEAELHQRAAKEKNAQNLKGSGMKGLRELKGLLSSIN